MGGREVQPKQWVLAVAAAVIGIGCGAAPPRSAADIEAAVSSYLANRADLNLGEVDVKAARIRYDGDRAVASVSISASGDPKAVMTMLYELQLGEAGWEVVPSPAQRPGTQPEASQGVLPPGHPPLVEPKPALPPGHPPLDGGSR